MAPADAQAGLRREFKVACARRRAAEQTLCAQGLPGYLLAEHLPSEDWNRFAGLKCGAKTRAGTPCKQTALYSNGRCGLHGGLSTGPKTALGKVTSAQNGKCPKRTP